MRNTTSKSNGLCKKLYVSSALLIFFSIGLNAQSSTPTVIPAGSFIVNMGIVPQTVANGLKPYGLVYELLTHDCPVDWVINQSKSKDGPDFTYNGVQYRGGPFIIRAEYRIPVHEDIINKWKALGVQGITTTAPITVPVFLTFKQEPRWTMDLQNGAIAVNFFNNAGIPSSAYGGSSSNWKLPANLDCCDDVFVMPHADPTWTTHRRLFDWVQTGTNGCKGGVWLGCHAGSALMDMFDNITSDGDAINYNQQTNFLLGKTGQAIGAGPYSENSLLLWDNHDDGTLPYSYDHSGDPVMQFMGTIDAAVLNGSEQIFIPKGGLAGWNPLTKVGVYDTDHPQRWNSSYLTEYRPAILAYGPAFNEASNGLVMLQAAHNISGTSAAQVAAQRSFFNYSFLVAWQKAVVPVINDLPQFVNSGQEYLLSYTRVPNVLPEPPQTYQTLWSASCGGTFLPNATSSQVTFIPPTTSSPTLCNISVNITDNCGRKTFFTHSMLIECNISVQTTALNPCAGVTNGGAIVMNFTGGSGPFTYSWTRTGGGSGSGTLTTQPYTITGLQAGTYNVTATSQSGTGCAVSFTQTLVESPATNINASPIMPSCFGATNGAINVNVTGGTTPYTYAWTGPDSYTATTQNIINLKAGTYTLTLTDARGCISTSQIVLTQPTVLTATPTATPVSCYNAANGTISLAVTGGTTPYQYLWNDGSGLPNRTGLAAGTYSVTVTDAKGCIATASGISVNQPSAALNATAVITNVACYGASTGGIVLSPTGGTPGTGYTYAWSGPNSFAATTKDISGLKAGNYTVLITDSLNCTVTKLFTVTQPPAINIVATVVQPTCPPQATQSNSDGIINIAVTGGSGTYNSFSWTGPDDYTSTNQNISGLKSGTYTVTVTDSNSCTKMTTVTLSYLKPILPTPGLITK